MVFVYRARERLPLCAFDTKCALGAMPKPFDGCVQHIHSIDSGGRLIVLGMLRRTNAKLVHMCVRSDENLCVPPLKCNKRKFRSFFLEFSRWRRHGHSLGARARTPFQQRRTSLSSYGLFLASIKMSIYLFLLVAHWPVASVSLWPNTIG